MSKPDPPLVVRLTLRAERDPDGVPADNRLRRLLKAMLRGYGFRCIAVEDVRAAPQPSPDAANRPDGRFEGPDPPDVSLDGF